MFRNSSEITLGKNRSIAGNNLPAVADVCLKGVSLGVMSKAYGLAGLRIGWIATKDKELMDNISSFKDYISICQSAPSEYLSKIALKNREKILKRNLAVISENLQILDAFFLKYSDILEWVRPDSASLGFVRIKTGETADSFCLDAVEKAGILLLPSTVFGYENSHFRIGFGRSDMKEALLRFDEFLEKKYNIK
ncbi:MAG: aminotransferase class I/II-fold pyridoxal phosphate-dependent enzyme [Methanomicrobiaceae archaeon]|nr:aminotransferase class I/II-fold pyridoxal phosphate-dependent enzyme [Methanomicrobiaceae archaeon]